MSYRKHPSPGLRSLFQVQEFPHQGRNPHKASIVIIGLDANYSPEITRQESFFRNIVDYHHDGVKFWKEHGVHHPFLLESYPLKRNTGGVPYHRRFAWLGLSSEYSEEVSFVEPLPVSATGQTKSNVFWSLFDVAHARNSAATKAQIEQIGFELRRFCAGE